MASPVKHSRRGSVLAFIVFTMVTLLSFVALALDLGYLTVVKSKLQATADSAALAGASALGLNDSNLVVSRAKDYGLKNWVNLQPVSLQDSDIALGVWDPSQRTFTPADPSKKIYPNAVKVTPQLAQSRGSGVAMFFAPLFGFKSMDVTASAVATYGARDIVLVLDYSGSMNDDSSLSQSSSYNSTDPTSIAKLGRSAVEQTIQNIYQKLGSPVYGKMQFKPAANPAATLTSLGLNTVQYPYSSGSWSEYMSWVRNYPNNADLGPYRNVYGYLTLIDYMQACHAAYSDTPVLWQVDEEPVSSVKDGVSVFITYMRQMPTDDRIGFVSFTYTDGTAHLEYPLTQDFDAIETRSNQMQAAHYYDTTNIAAGLLFARNELNNNGRAGAAKLIVLLTDGQANLPLNSHSHGTGISDAKAQADLAAKDHLPIITIALGVDADTDTLNYISNKTGGISFQVPGGKNVNDYRDQLYGVFAQIAGYQPLLLVD